MDEKYKAIINLPHHTSPLRKRMDVQDRAAQFAPYAALVGFGDVVEETARITEKRIIQDEGEIERLDRTLAYILSQNGTIKASFTYFLKDEKKSGGQYVTKVGNALKIDETRRSVTFSDKTFIPIDDIVNIEII